MTARRKDARSVKIKKTGDVTKFKVKTKKHKSKSKSSKKNSNPLEERLYHG